MNSNTFDTADAELMRSVIQRVATGPELSKNISYSEAKAVMHALLDGSADPVQAAVFLIGLRMKRETDEELKGVQDALIDRTSNLTSDIPEAVVIADPYNGFNRTLQGSLFVLPVLAACGVNAYSHGVELCGPKNGVTHHTILRALGGDPLQSMQQLAQRLADPAIGWGYADQSIFNPALYSLNKLRTQIVKRPVLSTTEVMLAPIKGVQKTHLVTGYVHKPYRETYAMLGRHIKHDSLLLIRGTEGGIIPSFKAKAHFVRYHEDDIATEHDVILKEIGLDRNYRAQDIPENTPAAPFHPERIGMKWDIDALATLCAEAGIRALEGESGAVQDAAVLGSALIMWHTGAEKTLADAADRARSAIKSGAARARLEAGLTHT
ncbi:hypothetical protein AB833_08605 [Chromatiales bacterium (ex Bugula neritina AB1)]|nr:hypothetical protein AB833_08605 [Chromatiales bacterium (ex Bugula neritina AB1)]